MHFNFFTKEDWEFLHFTNDKKAVGYPTAFYF